MFPQISQDVRMRRDDICMYVSSANRAFLDTAIADRNRNSKHIWRDEIVLATADCHGTKEIMRLNGNSKTLAIALHRRRRQGSSLCERRGSAKHRFPGFRGHTRCVCARLCGTL